LVLTELVALYSNMKGKQ